MDFGLVEADELKHYIYSPCKLNLLLSLHQKLDSQLESLIQVTLLVLFYKNGF